jgi:hypothetical protein
VPPGWDTALALVDANFRTFRKELPEPVNSPDVRKEIGFQD